MNPKPSFSPAMNRPHYLEAERPAPHAESPTFAQALSARVFGVVLLALLAAILIKCTA